MPYRVSLQFTVLQWLHCSATQMHAHTHVYVPTHTQHAHTHATPTHVCTNTHLYAPQRATEEVVLIAGQGAHGVIMSFEAVDQLQFLDAPDLHKCVGRATEKLITAVEFFHNNVVSFCHMHQGRIFYCWAVRHLCSLTLHNMAMLTLTISCCVREHVHSKSLLEAL